MVNRMDPTSSNVANPNLQELCRTTQNNDKNENNFMKSSVQDRIINSESNYDTYDCDAISAYSPSSGSAMPTTLKKDGIPESNTTVNSGGKYFPNSSNVETLLNGTSLPPLTSVKTPTSEVTNSHFLQQQPCAVIEPQSEELENTEIVGSKNGNGIISQDSKSLNCQERFSPNPHSRESSPNQASDKPIAAITTSPPPSVPPPPPTHVVHLHVNPGEAISFQMGDQMQLIQGPATVRMVSNNATPPIPMPVQVPPGHMVQQIVDENGTLRHVILSPHPQPPMTVSMGPTYAPGPTPNTGPTSPHFYPPYPHPYTPHPQYHHPHPTGPHPHMQPGVTHQIHGQVSPLSHQCNNLHSHQGPSPPPPPHSHLPHKDERTQRQIMKLKRKLESRQQRDITSSYHLTPPASPKKEISNRKFKDKNTNSSGLEETEENHTQGEEDAHVFTEVLSKLLPPTVSEIASRSALLKWKPPSVISENGENKYGDFDIKESDFSYEILLSDKSKDGKCKVVNSGNSLEYLLKDLKPATEYFVSLQAVLDDIRGTATESISFKTHNCEPDSPSPPKLGNRTKNSITLRWNHATDNGSKITNYILEYDEGKGNGHFVEYRPFSGSQKQCTLNKLNAATLYKFRLIAVNEQGKSKPSNVSVFSTCGSLPTQPNPPQLKEAHVNWLHLTWQKRPCDNEFRLQMDEELSGHGFLNVFNGKETQHKCNNLLRNTEYRFRLSAHNDEGPSIWSEVVRYHTLPEKPGPPVKLAAKGRIQSTRFKLAWDTPKDDGGSDITRYSLEMDSGKGFEIIYTGKDLEYGCEHLCPGTAYHFRVMCESAGGKSEYSDIVTVSTSPVCPGQCSPPRLYGKPKATTLHLKWVAPEYDGGAPVTEYEIDMTSPDNTTRQVYRGWDTDCMVAGLLPGRPYLFQVRAHNKIGHGTWSEPLEVVSGAGPPDRPKEPQVSFKSPQHALISWEEPVNNGATVTEFRLEWSAKDADFSLLYQGPSLNYEVKGLIPATQYNFRIQAINSAGNSLFSSISTCISPSSSPGCILSSTIRYHSTATSILVSWQEPATNGSDIVSYNIDLGDRHPLINIDNVTEKCIDGLAPETVYRLRIQAVNGVGVGPFSSCVKVTTLALPPSPPRLECTGISHNSLKLKWGEGKNPDFIQYTLEMENKSGLFVPVYQGPILSHKITKLIETTDYRFRIFASNAAGDGERSDIFIFTTCKAPPPPLKAPKAFDVSESSCQVDWMPAKQLGDDTIIYQLQLLNGRDSEFRIIYKGSETTYRIEGLEPKTEYSVRVGTIRLCRDGQADLVGAFSPSTSFVTSHKEPVRTPQTRTMATLPVEREPLSDQQWAVIILVFFTMVAVLIAVLIHHFAYNKSSSPA